MILMYLIPYYQTKNIQINIEDIDGVFFAKGAVAIKDAQQFQIGQKVDMILYYMDGDHILNGSIYTMTEFDGKAIVLIQLESQDDENKLSLLPSGEASITISSAPLLKRVLNL